MKEIYECLIITFPIRIVRCAIVSVRISSTRKTLHLKYSNEWILKAAELIEEKSKMN